MNRSWGNNSNNSSGFVYFNTDSSYPDLNTSDYMSFNESSTYGSPQCNRFSPVNYSSPNKFQKSPRNFHGRQAGRNSFRYHNSRDNSFHSPNRSFNSPGFNNSRKKGGHYQHPKNNNSFNGKRDMSKYLDYTSTKDPWAELQQKLKETEERCSSSSADEQESGSETKTSSSDVEDEAT